MSVKTSGINKWWNPGDVLGPGLPVMYMLFCRVYRGSYFLDHLMNFNINFIVLWLLTQWLNVVIFHWKARYHLKSSAHHSAFSFRPEFFAESLDRQWFWESGIFERKAWFLAVLSYSYISKAKLKFLNKNLILARDCQTFWPQFMVINTFFIIT